MKDSSTSTSRSASVRLGSDQGSSSTAATESSMPSPASSGGTSKTCFKDPMFSSSDTDDCDADKLVIDLDATGSTDNSSCVDAKQATSSVVSTVLPPASSCSTAVVTSRSDSAKPRTGESGSAKSSSGVAHRQSLSAGKTGSNQDGGLQPAHPPTEKGLKMKIKCSQIGGAGGPARHEISQFHTLVNSSSSSLASPAGSSNTSSAPPGGVKSNNVGGVVVAERDKEVHVKIDRLATSTNSNSTHRKEHKTNAKEKERNSNKDRPLPDVTSSSISTLQTTLSSMPIAGVATACANNTSFKEASPSNDISVKSPMETDAEPVPTLQKDPYEFNVKTEESVVGRPTKKIKLDKFDAACSPMIPGFTVATDSSSSPSETRDVSVDACHVGVLTDPDCLGPCEPGTTVTLEGIVWNETENGLLVVNVTWRGKTYVGTLMDATRHHWAPPRFATDSPTSDLDGRTPKGRGKRGRTCTNRLEINGSDRKLRSNRCAAAAAAAAVKSGLSSAGSTSPVRSESGPVAKRPRGSESQMGSGSSYSDVSRGGAAAPTKLTANRAESRTPVTPADMESNGIEGALIECPAPNCNKKYRHINGLRYHQSRSHPNMNFDDDADDTDEKLSSGNSKMKIDHDVNDMESASDVDRNDAIDSSAANISRTNELISKHDRKSKSDRSKAKAASKQSLDSQDTPSSPSVNLGKSSHDDASTDKLKYRKKDRVKDAAGLDQVDSAADDDSVKSKVGQGSLKSELSSFHAEAAGQLIEDAVQVKRERCGETVSVIRTAGEINSTLSSLSNGEMHSSSFQVLLENASLGENAVAVDRVEASTISLISSSSTLAVDRCAASPGSSLPSKRTKLTPTKYGPDLDNPHSPAYSDISDANDSAPMLEKEATPSAADDDITANGCSVVERSPVSQRLTDNFINSYNSSAASSSLYGQPPCLTPAVIPLPSLDGTQQHPVNVKMEKLDSSTGNLEDRPGHSIDSKANLLRPPRMPSDGVRHPGPEILDQVERNLGTLQRPVSRSHGGDASSPSPQVQQPGPGMLHPNLFMQYPYGAAPGGYPPLELLQHQEYRERLVQQGMMRRPDQLPSSSLSKPPVDFLPDFKGFPGPMKPSDSDRKNNKNDIQIPPGSLPTPPSLIPDRSMVSYDDPDSRVMKQKNSDRRDDALRSACPPHQQYGGGGGGDRQRRHDEAPSNKESNNIKPSAVVAPQARDRSTKVRPEDQSRGGHKPSSIKSSTNQDAMSSRQSKDGSSDRSNRDDKSLIVGRSGSTSSSYKKEEPGMSSPITSVPLPLPTSYPPFYPYLSPQFDPAAFYSGLNPMIGYGSGPPGPFLHPAQVGYLPQSAGADVGAMISPAVGPNLSPSEGKTRDGVPPRGFYPGSDGLGVGTPSPMHKIHELKDVAKGVSGLSGDALQSSGGVSTSGSAMRDVRPESRGNVIGGGPVGLAKDLDRAGTASPPTQRHVHTHHHMHMLGPAIPPLFGSVFPSDSSMMASSQAGPTSSNCPPLSRPFIGK